MGRGARTWLRRLSPLIGVCLFALAAYVLHRVVAGTDLDQLRASAAAIPMWALAAAVAATVVGYAALVAIDALACRHAGRPLPLRRVALASFIGHSFTHTLGNALIVGGSVRYRLYSSWGLTASQVALVIAFCFVAFWVGFPAVAGIALLADPPAPGALPLPAPALGALLLLAPAAWLLVSLRRRPLRLASWSVPLPAPGLAGAQIGLGATEVLARALVLWPLLPDSAGLGFGPFLGAYAMAMVAGKLSQVPGGLGVLEGTFLLLVPESARTATLGALAVYRGIYYVAPLAAAALLLGGFEAVARRAGVRRAVDGVAGWAGLAVRHLMAGLAVVAAGGLALAAVLPPSMRLSADWPGEAVPLLLAGIAAALLVVARGLQRKLARAWGAGVLLMAAGAVLAWVVHAPATAAAAAVGAVALLPCRREFHRGARLRDLEFTAGWVGAIAMVLLLVGAAALAAHPHATWSPSLWWTPMHDEPAAGALRGVCALVAALLAVCTATVLRRQTWRPPPVPGAADRTRAWALTTAHPSTAAALAGAPQLLFSEGGDAVLPYRVEGRLWIAIGDPVGAPEAREELAWRFRDLCDHLDGQPIALQTSDQALWADLGLSPQRIGDAARIALTPTRASAPTPAALGCRFAVLPADAVLPLPSAPTLAGASRARHPEIGAAPIAALLRADDTVVAAGPLFGGAPGGDLALDPVRLADDAPREALACLLEQAMAWGRDRGCASFVIPLVAAEPGMGVELARGAYAYGELLTPEAVRRLAERWDPVWEPRWLCMRPGLRVPRALAAILAAAAPGASARLALALRERTA